MVDVDEHKQPPDRQATPQATRAISLTQWVYQVAGITQAQVKSRVRGNSFHLLIESQPCPDAAVIVPRLASALATPSFKHLLPSNLPPIYRVILYGGTTGNPKPSWTRSFYLNPSAPKGTLSSEHAGVEISQSNSPGGVPLAATDTSSNLVRTLDLAHCGDPAAIARYLGDCLNDLGVSVRAKVEIGQTKDRPVEGKVAPAETRPTSPRTRSARLLIVCESPYSPDPSLLAEPLSQRLRELELTQFQDAIVIGQVSGETRPEWLLRVDLTPPDQILRRWSRWGDVQAITRLLNRGLIPKHLQVSALLKDATLHLTCSATHSASPDQATAMATIAPLLKSLTPQGIHAATIYGVAGDPAQNTAILWIDWVNLPATAQPALAATTLDLAQQGNLSAIEFLLTRLLNPSLDAKLATGGLRVQVRQKEDLLHVMTEAPTCPVQSQVGPAIARFLKPLHIASFAGVRIYGRRAGQKQPLWSYGVDFATRNRLVPEASPEFAASDSYVSDLLSPPGALVLRTEEPENWRSLLDFVLRRVLQATQRSLIHSQLFVPLESTSPASGVADASLPTPTARQHSIPVALVWGAVGLLLAVQSDWLLGQLLELVPQRPNVIVSQPAPSLPLETSPAASPRPSPRLKLPNLPLNKSKPKDSTVFNPSGFTRPGASLSTAEADGQGLGGTPLLASPPQPKAAAIVPGSESYPSFNSRQLDQQVAAYQRFLEKNGPPDVLVIGSSRALRGVDPVALKTALAEQGIVGVTVFNFGVNGATAQVVDLVLRQMLPQEALPKLIVWADGARAFNSGRPDVTYNGIVASQGYQSLMAGILPFPGTLTAQTPATKGSRNQGATALSPTGLYESFNQHLNQRLGSVSLAYGERDRLKTILRDQLTTRLPQSPTLTGTDSIAGRTLTDSTSPPAAAATASPTVLAEAQGMVDVNGFLALPNRFNPATYYQKYARVPGDYDSDYEAFILAGEQTEALTNLAQFAQVRRIPLVFVNLPLTKDYLDFTRKRHEELFQQHMIRLSTQLGFIFRDLGQALPAVDYFSDPSHLNRYGGYAVSRRLAQDALIPWSQVR